VVAILLNTCITFGRSILKDWKVVLISVLSLFGFFLRWNILLIFVLAAVAALLLQPKGSQAKNAPVDAGLRQEGGMEKEHRFLCLLAAFICVVFGVCYLIDSKITYLSLSLSKIGALAFGGGFTTIPMIQYEVVDRFNWLSTKEFLDGIALGQVTPGPILITATFIGYKVSGFLGASMATFGIFFPSFFILILLIPYHDRLKGVETVRTIERGILGSFIGMLGLVLYNFGRTALIDIPSIVLAGAAFFALIKKFSLPYILLSGGILSILLFGFLM
jgi:chromate transporter